MKFRIQLFMISIIAICLGNPSWSAGNDLGRTGLIMGANVMLWSAPDNATPVSAAVSGPQSVSIETETEFWYKVRLQGEQTGWVPKSYLTFDSGYYPGPSFKLSRELIAFSKKYLKTPYVYGGKSPQGFDCSGFTRFVYSKFGYEIPRRSAEQMRLGMPVSKENLLPADLIFFTTTDSKEVSHVGIYIGNGQFIHASSGAQVVRIDNLDQTYYRKRYRTARRLLHQPQLINYFSKLQLPK